MPLSNLDFEVIEEKLIYLDKRPRGLALLKEAMTNVEAAQTREDILSIEKSIRGRLRELYRIESLYNTKDRLTLEEALLVVIKKKIDTLGEV